MADKLVRNYQKPNPPGIKESGKQSTIKGPTYPASDYTPWNKHDGGKGKR